MASFAKLNDSNVVIACEKVADEDTQDENGNEVESIGVAYLSGVHGYTNWKKYSRGTKGGKYYNYDSNGNLTTEHSDQSKAFRKNAPSVGFVYDSGRDAFIEPKTFDSWVLNETTCCYDPPVAYPTVTEVNGKAYDVMWDETNTRWIAPDPEGTYSNEDGAVYEKKWDTSTSSWVDL